MVKVKKDMTGWIMSEHGVPDSRLTVIRQVSDYINPKGEHKARWLCVCSCGNKVIVEQSSLKNGRTKSCGCYALELRKALYTKRNKYEEYDEYIVGTTNDGKSKFKFDKEDFDKVKKFTWYINDQGYVISTKSNVHHKRIRLSRLVMNAPDGFEVDHINHDLLDNRKSNLRIVTHQQNLFNQQKSKNNTSGFVGVVKRENKWIAQIMYNGKNKYLGIFDTVEEAVNVYNTAAQELFGEYMYKNN